MRSGDGLMTDGLTFRHDKTWTRHDWVVVGPGGAVENWNRGVRRDGNV